MAQRKKRRQFTQDEITRRHEISNSLLGSVFIANSPDWQSKESRHVHIGVNGLPCLNVKYAPSTIIRFLAEYLLLNALARDPEKFTDLKPDITKLVPSRRDISWKLRKAAMRGFQRYFDGEVYCQNIHFAVGQILLHDCSESVKRMAGPNANALSLLADFWQIENYQDDGSISAPLWMNKAFTEGLVDKDAWVQLKEMLRQAEEFIYEHLPDRLYRLIWLLFYESLNHVSGKVLSAQEQKELEKHVANFRLRKVQAKRRGKRSPEYPWYDSQRRDRFIRRVDELRPKWVIALDSHDEQNTALSGRIC